LLGVKHTSSSLDKSYGSKDVWQDPKAVAEGISLLLSIISSLLTSTCRCLAQYSFSTYFRKACWYCAV
jgi:hypothetical protein